MLLFHRAKNGRRRGWWPRVAQMEILDGRQLLSAAMAPAIAGNVQAATSVGTQPDDWDPVAEERRSAPAVPAYSSLPNAPVSIYLDFNGHFQPQWGSEFTNINSPVFDRDGDPSSFNNVEKDAIEKIWAQVSEDYAPFQVNVTTVKPSSFADGVGLRVVIGGDDAWRSGRPGFAGGTSLPGSFTSSSADPNVVYTFPNSLSRNSKYIADNVSHEAGHAFGLVHQARYNNRGELIEGYHTGSAATETAPIMGSPYYATRALWWSGTPIQRPNGNQDDLAVLSKVLSYRADDHGDTRGSASLFTVSGNQLSVSGIITKTSDVDVFKIDAAAGSVTVNLVLPANNNLHGKIKLSDNTGRTLVEVDPPGVNDFNATLTAQVTAGTYFVTVASHGGYGDIGQYSLTGTFVAPVAADTNLVATSNSSTRVSLTWQDNATNETAHVVERSNNGGQSFMTVATLGANVTSYTDNTVSGGTTYQYRVRAFNSTATALNSNVASVTTPPIPTPPIAPSGATATVLSARSVRFTWADNSNNETSFVIQRQLNNGSWTDVATVGANTTSFTDSSLNPRTTVRYRVRAINNVGVSAWSLSASVTTPRA